jgi:putative chitinase
MNPIDRDKFLFLYSGKYGVLKPSQIQGIATLLESLEGDTCITDPRHAAYMLATVKHECAGTWQPIEEYGKGKGYKYGIPSPKTGKAYYGRGYVQLTWAENYIAMSKPLGVNLYQKPELALDPKVAYQIMSYGMRKGSFTGKKLAHYIEGEKCDYINARRIINGTDCAEKIAGYAEIIEEMLTQCV